MLPDTALVSSPGVGAASLVLDPAATDEGFHLVPLLDGQSLHRLREAFDDLGLPDDHGFHATSANGTREVARTVDRYLKAELGPALASLFPDHEPFLAAFISKGARQGSLVDFHQDWTYTDERTHRAVILWIPLLDTTRANGTLRAVPGSHRWASGLRASGGQHATDPLQAELAAASIDVPLAAGTAFVYDPALIHGSDANPTDHVRPAAAIALAPRGAPLVHFHAGADGRLSGWAIDESFFTTQEFGSCPVGCDPLEPWDRLVATDDLAVRLAS
jgi:hypothetical protein